MKNVLGAFTRFLAHITRNPFGMVGAVITTIAAILFVTLFAFEAVGMSHGPYLGILAFLILPGFFLLGLLLIPIGLWRERGRHRRSPAAGGEQAERLPVWDLNVDRVRRNFLVFLALTAINLVILSTAMYKGVEVMDSTPFCGAACHSVMRPEYTTYQRSPHARVKCVECHIGAGANWFVKSKLSGSWQLVAVTFDLYPRPIPVPVHNLRPARETCEQCHWPQKFVGDRFQVNTHYQEDEANTEVKTVLVVKVGGRQSGRSHGIHWHVDPDHVVRYRSDEKRQTIYEVEMSAKDGTVRRFTAPSADTPEGKAATEWRTMDCVDCHNRPTHIYRPPELELDNALFDRRIDVSLPYIRREGLKALRVEYTGAEAARAGIAKAISGFYQQSYPQVAKDKAEQVEAAGRALGDIWSWNVFPSMNIKWGTYRNHLGHTADMAGDVGCFRCHDEQHRTHDGKTISQDCGTCHSLLAQEERDPPILKTISQ
ncbi:MAG TPA: NapC/NirT family cytochrome c [Vicinamibacteria bacterium]|nr:NapC/NirT family cytochrome c [Vicinamibacteria bacterium]